MAKNNNLTDFLTDTANAIRTKKGTTGKINPQDFSSEIVSIQTGVDTSDATATADDILLGKTAYAKGEKLTGTIETYAGEGGETVNKLASLVDGTLTEITAEDLAGATGIRNYAFYRSPLISITIPNSVTSIGKYAFYNCTSLTNITIPSTITSIEMYTFYSCSKLTNIPIPITVTSIGDYAFCYCTSITSITIPSTVTSIGIAAFQYCKALTSITIPDGIKEIASYLFDGCSSLTSITIPNSVTSIESSVFYGCSALSKINIPDGIKKIENYLFVGCSSLTAVTIPNSVTDIGYSALQIGSSTNKATITMLRTTPPTIQSSTFNASYLEKIIVPAGTGATYKAATNWSNFADYIEEAAE